MANFTTGKKLFFPSVGRLIFLYAYRPKALVDETANATNAPGPMPNNRDTHTDINDLYVTHAYAHKGVLRETAKQMVPPSSGKYTSARQRLFFGEGGQNANSTRDE